MAIYEAGQRVELVYTDDLHTDLKAGDTGTVQHHDTERHIVYINWDNGSNLSMCLDAHDYIRIAGRATPE